MTFIRMVLSDIDPFAVYAAERELSEHGITVTREQLAAHYSAQGQLRTAVSKLTASPPPASIKEAFAAALIDGPDESANPRFVAPLRMGILYSAVVLIAIAIEGGLRMSRLVSVTDQVRWDWVLTTGALLIGICMAYALLGARIGKRTANKFLSLGVALAFLGFMYWLTRHLR